MADVPRMNKKFQASSVGGKVRAVKYHAPVLAVKVRALVLEWFVKARTAMKGRIPSKLFKLKAIEFYDDEWFQNREKEYEVSSRKSDKRHSVSIDDSVVQVIDYLQSIWIKVLQLPSRM